MDIQSKIVNIPNHSPLKWRYESSAGDKILLKRNRTFDRPARALHPFGQGVNLRT